MCPRLWLQSPSTIGNGLLFPANPLERSLESGTNESSMSGQTALQLLLPYRLD